MDRPRFSFTLAVVLALGILAAGCAQNSRTASTGATAPENQKRYGTDRSARELVPLNQQGGY